MMKNMQRGLPNILKQGAKHLSGINEAVLRNLAACKQLSDVTRTSLGPQGMNKMIINRHGRLSVTSDTSAILHDLEVEHAAANILVMAAQMQEQEVGDGSNFVLILAGELLAQAEDLIYLGLHPQDIISGYLMAGKKAMEVSKDLVVNGITTDQLFDEKLVAKAIQTAIATKQYGYEEQLSKLVADACIAVMPKNTFNFAVDNVRVCKVLGGDISQSHVVRGMVFNQMPLPSSITSVNDAKIAVFTCAIDAADTETKGTALLSSADDLVQFNKDEESQVEKLILDIKSSGVNVVVTGGTVSDLAAHYLEKHEILCIRIQSKFELRRLCRAVNARPLVTLGSVAPEYQGHCSRVYTKEIGLSTHTFFEHNEGNDCPVSTIILRAATFNTLNDVERAIDDGVNTVKAMGKERAGHFLPGAGAYETELAHQLYKYANTITGIQQYAINKFADSLLIIPRTLAENAGYDAVDVVARLLEQHQKGGVCVGIDIEAGAGKSESQFMDVNVDQVYDLYGVKSNALRLVLDCVATILRIDQIVQSKAAGGPRLPQNKAGWDDDADEML